MAIATVPSASVQARAQILLSERDDWRYWRDKQTGVEYVSVPSGEHVYRVRRDGHGCECKAYVRGGLLCSHRIAVIEAANEDSLALGLATDAEIAAHMAQSAGQFRREEETRRRLITSSPFFQDAPVAVRVRTLSTYERLYPEGED